MNVTVVNGPRFSPFPQVCVEEMKNPTGNSGTIFLASFSAFDGTEKFFGYGLSERECNTSTDRAKLKKKLEAYNLALGLSGCELALQSYGGDRQKFAEMFVTLIKYIVLSSQRQ
jgi:hypothetical protein